MCALNEFSQRLVLAIFACAFFVIYANSVSASQCEITDASEDVVLIVCPLDNDQEAWRLAGESACAANAGICNAWIWNDEAKAPQAAPETDADMSEEQVRSAVAVWVNDAKRLVLVDKAKPE